MCILLFRDVCFAVTGDCELSWLEHFLSLFDLILSVTRLPVVVCVLRVTQTVLLYGLLASSLFVLCALYKVRESESTFGENKRFYCSLYL